MIVIEPLEGMLYWPKPMFIESAFSQETRNVHRCVLMSTRSQIPPVAGVIEVDVGTAKAGAWPAISRFSSLAKSAAYFRLSTVTIGTISRGSRF